jgi:hypothetical protein
MNLDDKLKENKMDLDKQVHDALFHKTEAEKRQAVKKLADFPVAMEDFI